MPNTCCACCGISRPVHGTSSLSLPESALTQGSCAPRALDPGLALTCGAHPVCHPPGIRLTQAQGLPPGIQRGERASPGCPALPRQGGRQTGPPHFKRRLYLGGHRPPTMGLCLSPAWPVNPSGARGPCLGRGCPDFITER